METHRFDLVRKYSFFQRSVNEWNKLLADYVQIENYLVRAGYT